MIVFNFKSGRVVRITSRDSSYCDPATVSVVLECEETIQFGNFVYDAAIRWKIGEAALFNELLVLLLRQMISGKDGDGNEDDEQSEGAAAAEDMEDKEEEEERQCDDVNDSDNLGSLMKLETTVKFETPGDY
jgi:hypothetical protein